MIIALAQIAPFRGNFQSNLRQHLHVARVAHRFDVDLLLFPELSLTGYEPSLAKELALPSTHTRFSPLQEAAQRYRMTIACGMPLSTKELPQIGLLTFAPDTAPSAYAKNHLHPDETPYFSPGKEVALLHPSPAIAPAICYELGLETHLSNCLQLHMEIYATSVAKTATGLARAHEHLQLVAKKHSVMSLLVNAVGECEEGICAGGSAVWAAGGQPIGLLSRDEEGLLIVDTDMQRTKTHQLQQKTV
ncbi:carbon-nitrogen hydrolase family protein [Marinoscillum furvescens]|uniref:Putative amidohydrolase n=1 Tax=Marinoscillum furvescens DSM 4134 TaxID=1122208 RepID=A0A3D9LGY8_MARFU|nr:carbon-nitrogen hydrolase family protein [Marinoscillum furvescens]REE05661.1 putative amidohydrolase [Marinoscillum furvescens DSM 4134]